VPTISYCFTFRPYSYELVILVKCHNSIIYQHVISLTGIDRYFNIKVEIVLLIIQIMFIHSLSESRT